VARRTEASPRNGEPAGSSRKARGDFRPTREQILAWVTENPDRAGKRDIAKAFSLKAGDRIWLKDLLRELQDEGVLVKQRKRLARRGALPHVAVLDIFSRDAEGGLLARPAERDSDDETNPLVSIRLSRGGKGPVPGVGDRVLARTFPADDPAGPAYTARVMKIIDRRREAVLGVLRAAHDGTLRIEPVERGQAELVVEPEALGEARPGDLVEVEPVSSARYGLPRGRVIAVIG
jgi:ribonuclease R